MTTHESWMEYVRRFIAQGLDRKEIAEAADVDTSTVSRWTTGDSGVTPEKAINLARRLKQSPIEALVAAGYLDATDVEGAVEVKQSLSVVPDETIIDELRDRLAERSSAGVVTDDAEPTLSERAQRRKRRVKPGAALGR